MLIWICISYRVFKNSCIIIFLIEKWAAELKLKLQKTKMGISETTDADCWCSESLFLLFAHLTYRPTVKKYVRISDPGVSHYNYSEHTDLVPLLISWDWQFTLTLFRFPPIITLILLRCSCKLQDQTSYKYNNDTTMNQYWKKSQDKFILSIISIYLWLISSRWKGKRFMRFWGYPYFFGPHAHYYTFWRQDPKLRINFNNNRQPKSSSFTMLTSAMLDTTITNSTTMPPSSQT